MWDPQIIWKISNKVSYNYIPNKHLMELREILLHSPLDFKHQMIELGSSSISLPSCPLIYGIIIVGELGVLRVGPSVSEA